MKTVAIVDYGAGNLFSLMKALRYVGASPTLVETPEAVEGSEALIIPGVGAFPAGMKALQERGLVSAVQTYAQSGKPLLGICLGAQLLMSDGYEFGHTQGLGCVPGRVIKFPDLAPGYRVPNINWNPVEPPEQASPKYWQGTPLAHTLPGSQYYFVHSFICEPEDDQDILAQTTYGGFPFCSVYRRGNIVGSQFHPEKSGEVGLQFLKTFLDNL
ncbi:imidazole glycerol phosphate synthase subunit HisH [Candidatus Uhrbacteria bacterium]|nr:imidazole glycerol phosphate synthase subunit HisH [Candidatus Uhrbacteria bacterium]